MNKRVAVKLGEGLGSILQPCRGYRFSPELLYLPQFIGQLAPDSRILDLGSGSGILLVLLFKSPHCGLDNHGGGLGFGLELQPEMAALARENLEIHGLGHRCAVTIADVRNAPIEQGSFDMVVTNPPYYSPGTGRPSSSSIAAACTHQLNGTIDQFCETAATALKPGGRMLMVYPAELLTEALCAVTLNGLVPQRLCIIHHLPRQNHYRIFLETVKPHQSVDTSPDNEINLGQKLAGLKVEEIYLDYLAART